MPCINCGGDMVGDGFTSVNHCENALDHTHWYLAPDAGPVYCCLELVPAVPTKAEVRELKLMLQRDELLDILWVLMTDPTLAERKPIAMARLRAVKLLIDEEKTS